MEQQQQPKQKQEETFGGFMTAVLCGLVILAFIGWIVWLVIGGQDSSKAVKKMTVEQVNTTIAEAAKADPELKALIVRKAPTPKASEIFKVDINSATAEQLAKIPGLSEWDVNAIVKRRPFASLDELLSKRVLGESRYAAVKDFLSLAPAPSEVPSK